LPCALTPLAESEGAKFWLQVLTDLKNRGLSDIFVACIDGLAGFPEAIRAAYPQTEVQLCVVHLVRAVLRYVAGKDSKAAVRDLKNTYQAATLVEAEQALEKSCSSAPGPTSSSAASTRSHPRSSGLGRQSHARALPRGSVMPAAPQCGANGCLLTLRTLNVLNRAQCSVSGGPW
jgi:hypothetical protein